MLLITIIKKLPISVDEFLWWKKVGGEVINCCSREKKKRLPHNDLQKVWAERILQESEAASC